MDLSRLDLVYFKLLIIQASQKSAYELSRFQALPCFLDYQQLSFLHYQMFQNPIFGGLTH